MTPNTTTDDDSTDNDRPDWLPDDYDPEAPLRERLPILADIDGGIELHVRDEKGTTDVLGSPVDDHEHANGTYELRTGSGEFWTWEIVVPGDAPAFVRKVDPDQSYDAYIDTRTRYYEDVDVRCYGVDADRLHDGEEVTA